MATDTRQRMIEAASALLQQGGLEAASFTEILNESGAARGAIYHHFPGGKSELVREAVTWTGHRIRRNIAGLRANDPEQAVGAFLDQIRGIVADASVGRSCAVAAVAVEAGQGDEELTSATGAALQSWIDALRIRLVELGVSPPAARQASTLLIIFLEGAQVLCRAVGNLAPFDDTRAAMERAVRELLVPASASR